MTSVRRKPVTRLQFGLLALLGVACQTAETPPVASLEARARPASVAGVEHSEPVVFSPSNELAGDISPDERYVLYVSDETGNLDVWIYDYLTRASLPLTKSSAEDYDPAFSPDGRRLVFVSRRFDAKGDVFVMDRDDETDDPDRLTGVEMLERQPVFAPDGSSLYFTASAPVGVEHIYRLWLEDRRVERISKTPGFDPAPSPDGRYLVYTAPEGEAGVAYPHLVMMRLTDSATRALTASDDGPCGFPHFMSPVSGRQRIALVRFPFDDNEDGILDGADQASLWRLEVDPDALFAKTPGARRPMFPLTTGSRNELFPFVGGDRLYFTETARLDRDLARLPEAGFLPTYETAAEYTTLAKTLPEPRERWFAYLAALAIAEPGEPAEARAFIGVANEHLSAGRLALAESAFRSLVEVTREAAPDSREREFGGIAEVELIALARRRQLASLRSEIARERVLRDTQRQLELVARRYADRPAVLARMELEGAEILFERGDRLRAIEALDQIEQRRADQPYSVARAMLRRVELLRVAFDPNAIGEAYRRIAERFPEERGVVMEAAAATVEAHVASVGLEGGARPAWDRSEEEKRGAEVDVLRRLITRSVASPVRQTARARLAGLLRQLGQKSEAALELAALVEETVSAKDRNAAARALAQLAQLQEERLDFEPALASWTELRESYADLPGVELTAREAVTRVAMAKADREEALGQKEAARASYRAALDNDPGQVRALRRYLALSAELGLLEEVLAEARVAAQQSPRNPIARYRLGVAASWRSPPDLDEAEREVSRALELNPQLVAGYITRGWVYESRYVETRDLDWLEKAITDYEVAVRLNREAVDIETEADAMLNLGNATWSLGVATNDDGNVRRSYATHVERLQTGVPFLEPVQEAVFWERLSRAAFWAEDWAMSVTAAREALRLTEAIGLDRRRAQIYGNLALAYGEAGAHEESTAAFLEFTSALEARDLTERLVVAKRSRAVSRIRAATERGETDLNSALQDLMDARRVVESGGYQAPSPPFRVDRTVPNASRGPLGLWLETEREVNLYWTERAHLLQGDIGLARSIHERRLELLEEETGDAKRASLNGIRVHLGALVAAARDLCRSGLGADCARRLEQAFALIERWRDDGAFASDRPTLVLDDARLQATFLETMASMTAVVRRSVLEGSAPLEARLEDTGRIIDALAESLPEAQRNLVDASFDESAPALLDYVATASVTGTLSDAGSDKAFLLIARLIYAEALSDLARAPFSAGRPDGSAEAELKAAVAELDLELGRKRRLAAAFARAARLAARVPGRLAAELHVAALEAAADVLKAPERAVVKSALAHLGPVRAAEAEMLAKLSGDAKALAVARAQIDAVAPLVHGPGEQAIQLVLARSASVALSAREMPTAFEILDRALLLSATGGPRARYARPTLSQERRFVSAYQGLLARTEAEERSTSGQGGKEATAGFNAAEALADLRESPTTEALGLRLFAESIGADFVKDFLALDEALVMVAPVAGVLQLFFVDGSTVAASTFLHATTELSAEAARQAVFDMRATLAAGLRPDPERVRELDAELFGPLAERLRGRRKLVLCDRALGGPLPAALFPSLAELAVTHVSAPSVIAAARSAATFGDAADVLIEAAPRDEPLLSGAPLRLPATEALAFRELDERKRGEEAANFAPGETRRVDARATVDRIAGNIHRLVVVDAPFRPADVVPERSTIDLSGEDRPDPTDLARTRFVLPLGDLDLPSRVLVLADADLAPRANFAFVAIELAAATGGTASVMLMPTGLQRDVRARILERFSAELDGKGAAVALKHAVAPELAAHPRVALVTLLGFGGLDEAGSKELAQSQVGLVKGRMTRASKIGDSRTVAEWAKRLARIHRYLNAADELEKAHRAAVAFMVQSGDYAEAAETQKSWIERAGAESDPAKAAGNWLLLGRIYSLARDYETAEEVLTRAIGIVEAAKKPTILTEALVERASNRTRWLRFAEAGADYEAAITVFEKAGAYKSGKVPPAALELLRSAAQLYLNQLSAPEKARSRYARFLKYAQRDEDKVAATLSLAQVARKLGEFDRAASLAEEARKGAAAIKRADLELEALTEATNVSWYQGDYARGLQQCAAGLALAEANLKRALADKTKKSKREVRGLVYTLSVCGLLHMSTRDFDKAKSALDRAVGLARRNDIPAEEATQYNNLGRVYLEFGRLDQAKASFNQAKALDERLSDRFGLAYDYRNLGTALFLQGEMPAAKLALEKALELSSAVNDPNNVLRATFALAELARAESRDADAKTLYVAARKLAEQLSVKELAWQIHRALGLIAARAGQAAEAERELRTAIALVRTLTGRSSGSTDGGLGRYQPFDDLLLLLLDQGREDEAFELAETARALAETEVLDDRRIELSTDEVKALAELRQAVSATTAAAAEVRLAAGKPRIARLLSVQRPALEVVPADALVISYRMTERQLIIFSRSGSELRVARVPIEARVLRASIAELMDGLRERAELRRSLETLTGALLAPLASALEGKQRLVFVPHGPLRYIPFAALYDPRAESKDSPIIESFVIASALDSENAITWLARPKAWTAELKHRAIGAAVASNRDALSPLIFADKEVELIREEFPRARIDREDRATRANLLAALSEQGSVIHFSGHGQLDDRDPLGGRLMTVDGALTLHEVLGLSIDSPLVVLSACETALATRADLAGSLGGGEDWLSAAQAFQLAGAERVLASTFRVSDLAAALVMKRFYRSLRTLEPAAALREAQRSARQFEPHPAWWATFTLMVR